MSDLECTAVENDWEDPPNPLFVPPCGCPKCTPDPLDLDEPSGKWLRISGIRQRFPVEAMALGDAGKAFLG